MAYNIDSQLSLYALIDRLKVNNSFTDRRVLLSAWSRSIEIELIRSSLEADIFVGFQQLRYFAPVLHRYEKIAHFARRLWVFGQPNATYPFIDNLKFAALRPDDHLSREWFLIVNHPRFTRALVAQEVTPVGTPHRDRLFRGILTHHPAMVSILSDWMLNSVERSLIG